MSEDTPSGENFDYYNDIGGFVPPLRPQAQSLTVEKMAPVTITAAATEYQNPRMLTTASSNSRYEYEEDDVCPRIACRAW